MGRIKDITGNVYGRLRVLSFDSLSEDDNRAWWNCVCTCGSTLPILGKSLRNGLTQSCGCLQKERATEFSTKHGGVGTPEYNAYRNAQARCTNPKCDKWEYYGGRGIKFLFTTFAQFFAELGKRPRGKTLDRINNDGNYEPGNVRWATKDQQNENKRAPNGVKITWHT